MKQRKSDEVDLEKKKTKMIDFERKKFFRKRKEIERKR